MVALAVAEAPVVLAQPCSPTATAWRHGVSAGANGNGAAPEQLLTAEDVAVRWQVPKSQVYRLAREGHLPVVELGRYKRFRPAAIQAFEEGGGAAADD
jgi:excisionase family DNA binding protein